MSFCFSVVSVLLSSEVWMAVCGGGVFWRPMAVRRARDLQRARARVASAWGPVEAAIMTPRVVEPVLDGDGDAPRRFRSGWLGIGSGRRIGWRGRRRRVRGGFRRVSRRGLV